MLRVDEVDLAFLSVTERVESPWSRAAAADLRGARRPAARRASARRPGRDPDGRPRRRAVHQLPAGCEAARAAVRPPAGTPASSRAWRSSPTRALGSGGWSHAASGSRSSAFGRRSDPVPPSRSPGSSSRSCAATSRSPGARAGATRRPPPSSWSWRGPSTTARTAIARSRSCTSEPIRVYLSAGAGGVLGGCAPMRICPARGEDPSRNVLARLPLLKLLRLVR